MNVRTTNKGLRSARNLRMVLAGVLILLCQCASAATYYVSTNGSDSNTGTQSAPFRHLSKGASAATQPGDTVIVMDGTYDNEGVVAPNFVVTLYHSGTAGNPITFQAQNRGKAILDSMNTSTTTACNGASSYFNLYNASFIVIQGFVIQRGCDSGIQSNDSAHDIVIKWNEIRNIANHTVTDQIGRDGIFLNSAEYNFTFDGNKFHDIGRTDGQTYLHFDHGIYSHSQSTTIINNQFYNMNRGWSVQLADGASNWTVANNTFAFGDANGESGQIMFWGANSNIAVMNNIFYNPNGAAMNQYAATLSNCSFNHNLVYGVSIILSGGTSGLTIGTNSIGAIPMFVNAASAPYDFHEQSGSASINAGIYLAAVPVDADGVSRPQGASTDQGAYEYVATTPPPIISGVFVSGISTNSAFINWSTDQPSTSYVQYGPSSYTNTTPTDSTLVTTHSVTLSGLAASSLYHFRVGSTNSTGGATLSPDYTVTTLAVPSTISLSAASSTLSLIQGNSATDGITATLLTGNPVSVSFSAASLPSGVTAAFSSSSCTATCSTTLTLSTSTAAPAGSYNIVVSGTGAASATTTIALTITAAPSPSDITTGLAARWTMTEGSGNYAYDSSGHGNTAILYNSPYWWTTTYGMALWFNGSAYGSVAENSSLEMMNQLTVSFWLDPNANTNKDPCVIEKLYDWDVSLTGPKRLPQFTSHGGGYATLNYSLPLNTWHHIVFTFNSGIVNGYVDGLPVAFLSNTFPSAGSLPQFAYGLSIGTDSSKSNYLIGSLDDVRLYNRALSAADVAALYAAKP